VHTYYSGLAACPWCRLEEASGVLLFLSRDSITKIDLHREWRKVEAIRPPGKVPFISPGNFLSRPAPLPPAIERSLAITRFRQFTGIVGIGGTAVAVLGGMIMDYLMLLPVAIIIAALFLVPARANGEKRRRRKERENARYLWDLWNRKWTSEAGDGAFFAQMNYLWEIRRKYEKIDQEFRAGLLSLEKTVKDRQLHNFLLHCTIETCGVPRVGAGLRTILKSSGIRNAADINRKKLLSIPQLDNTLTNELLSWRERMEKNFLFDPTRGIERTDLEDLIHKYQPMMKPVERELKQGIAKLQRIEGDIQKKRITLRPSVEKRARDLAQAEADFEVFGRTVEELIRRDIEGLIHPRRS
jgi:DNA-binding helix-hairpin-helix protein with protein kinase domain